MATYKRKNKKTYSRSSKQASRGWLRVVLGSCIGAVLTVAVFVNFILPSDFMGFSFSKTSSAEKSTVAKPRFDFYNILPEMEVKVPKATVPAAPKTPPKTASETAVPAPLTTEISQGQYRLQLASFKSYAEADRFKAQLALWGVEASIDTINLKGSETWHRVRTVLYPTRAQAEEVQKQLDAEGIHAILLKESK